MDLYPDGSLEVVLKKVSLILLFTLSLVLTACQPSSQVNRVTVSPTINQQTVVPTETLLPEEIRTESPTSTSTATEIPVISVMVSTERDIVDGDTSQIEALLADPGPDGSISLREAINAANQTSGSKLISFSSDLKGSVIILGPAQAFEDPRLFITMDQITVNGDVDGDGVSDITLDGTALDSNYSSAFVLSASQVTVENLQFIGFEKFALMVCCVDDYCAERTYEQITIRNNTITSIVGGGGIVLTPLKLVAYTKDPTVFSNITITDIQIMGNRIAVSNGGNGGIFIAAAGAGGSDNTLANILTKTLSKV